MSTLNRVRFLSARYNSRADYTVNTCSVFHCSGDAIRLWPVHSTAKEKLSERGKQGNGTDMRKKIVKFNVLERLVTVSEDMRKSMEFAIYGVFSHHRSFVWWEFFFLRRKTEKSFSKISQSVPLTIENAMEKNKHSTCRFKDSPILSSLCTITVSSWRRKKIEAKNLRKQEQRKKKETECQTETYLVRILSRFEIQRSTGAGRC